MREKVLVFVPTYNCAQQIPRVLAQLQSDAVREVIDGVVVVDNRSTDGTLAAAADGLKALRLNKATLLRNDNNYGLGGSHKVAIEFARTNNYAFLIVLHGDDQGSIGDILPLLCSGRHLNLDFLMGARFMVGSRLEGYSLARTMANRAFNLIFSAISGRRLYDLGSGLNLFRVEAFASDFHVRFADDLTFNYYLILAIVRRGFRLEFFPLSWREDDQVSNAKLGRMGLQLLRIVFASALRPQWFFMADHRHKFWEAYTSTRIWGC